MIHPVTCVLIVPKTQAAFPRVDCRTGREYFTKSLAHHFSFFLLCNRRERDRPSTPGARRRDASRRLADQFTLIVGETRETVESCDLITRRVSHQECARWIDFRIDSRRIRAIDLSPLVSAEIYALFKTHAPHAVERRRAFATPSQADKLFRATGDNAPRVLSEENREREKKKEARGIYLSPSSRLSFLYIRI